MLKKDVPRLCLCPSTEQLARSSALQESQALLTSQGCIRHRRRYRFTKLSSHLSPVPSSTQQSYGHRFGSIQVANRCARTGASGKRMVAYDTNMDNDGIQSLDSQPCSQPASLTRPLPSLKYRQQLHPTLEVR